VLRGRRTERVEARGHDQLSTFGLLAEMSVSELRNVVDQLVDQRLLAVEGEPYPVLRITDEGGELLRGARECRLLRVPAPPATPRDRRRRGRGGAQATLVGETPLGPAEQETFERLRALRREIAAERGVPPYVIFHDSTLRELARLRPTSLGQLFHVRGIGERKANDYGERLLALLAGGPAPAQQG